MSDKRAIARIICIKRIKDTFKLYNLKPTKEDIDNLVKAAPESGDETETYRVIESYIVKTYHIK